MDRLSDLRQVRSLGRAIAKRARDVAGVRAALQAMRARLAVGGLPGVPAPAGGTPSLAGHKATVVDARAETILVGYTRTDGSVRPPPATLACAKRGRRIANV